MLIKGFRGAYEAVPLYKMCVRTNIFVGYAPMGVVPELLVNGVTFLLGYDFYGHDQVVSCMLNIGVIEHG